MTSQLHYLQALSGEKLRVFGLPCIAESARGKKSTIGQITTKTICLLFSLDVVKLLWELIWTLQPFAAYYSVRDHITSLFCGNYELVSNRANRPILQYPKAPVQSTHAADINHRWKDTLGLVGSARIVVILNPHHADKTRHLSVAALMANKAIYIKLASTFLFIRITIPVVHFYRQTTRASCASVVGLDQWSYSTSGRAAFSML